MNLFPLALALIPIPVNSELKILMFLFKVSSAHVTSNKLLLFCSYIRSHMSSICVYAHMLRQSAAHLRDIVYRTFWEITECSLESKQRQCGMRCDDKVCFANVFFYSGSFLQLFNAIFVTNQSFLFIFNL